MVPEISSVTDRTFCHFGLFFTLFTLFFSLVHKCTKNHDYVLYKCCFSFWAIPPPPPTHTQTAQKMTVSKKCKQCLIISSFYTILPKFMIIGHTVPEIWHVTNVIFIFYFGLFFVLLSP